MIDGVWTSAELIVLCLICSIIFGLVGAAARESKSRILFMIVGAYVEFFRNTPPYVQLLFFYFGIGSVLPQIDMGGYFEPLIGRFGWAVISLSLFGGAFVTEIFRSGIESVPRTMREAAEALGYSRIQTFMHVVLPLALRFCLPALGGILISLLKYTSLAYAIAVPEVTYTSQLIWNDNFNVIEMMITLFIFYNLAVMFFSLLMSSLEKRLALPGYG
jgi:polar amino acid transport system permease protein